MRERNESEGPDSPDSTEPRSFQTLRGFIRGDEPDEPIYFAFSASLRIYGDGLPFDKISSQLGVQPTYMHRKGEQRHPRSPPWPDDAWHFRPSLAETTELAAHIDALWEVLKPHVAYLQSLKQRYKVDVFCGYRSNCDQAGLEVPHTSLELFTALGIPFGVSIIIA
jgi:hypothetical protein